MSVFSCLSTDNRPLSTCRQSLNRRLPKVSAVHGGGLSTIVAMLAIATIAAGAAAQDGIIELRALSTKPLAPRGGVILLPVARIDNEGIWPRQAELTLASGETIMGRLAWIGTGLDAGKRASAASAAGSWTEDVRGLEVRPISAAPPGGVGGQHVLLARLPHDGAGPILLGDGRGQRIDPLWRDLPSIAHHGPDDPVLPRAPGFDRPDADSPFEHWRWDLLAARLDHSPPPLDDFSVEGALVAEHFTNLWRLGLARLEAQSYGTAQHVRDLLTRIAHDGSVAFAAWVADPAQTDGLLSQLLNERRVGEALVRDALAWADEHERIRLWIESDTGDGVRIALLNPGFRPVTVQFAWEGVEQESRSVDVPAGSLSRATIDRPSDDAGFQRPLAQLLAKSRQPGGGDVLRITAGGRSMTIAFGARAAVVTPPGFWLPAMRPPLTLAEVQGSIAPSLDEDSLAGAHLRRLGGRWELFIECRRDAGGERSAGAPRKSTTSIDGARGMEAVIVRIRRSEDDDGIELIVPETGWHHLARGENDGTLQIHRRSMDDRWYCRVVLPDAWLGMLRGEQTFVAVMRTTSGSSGIEFSPRAAAPWQTEGGAVALDLSEWRDFPIIAP